jgi:hypothetical protein
MSDSAQIKAQLAMVGIIIVILIGIGMALGAWLF